MKNSDLFINSLEDFELAALNKYKAKSYTNAGISKIEEALKERGLTPEKEAKLLAETSKKKFTDKIKRCSRCKSQKVSREQEEKDFLGITSSYMLYCNVCGLSEEFPKESTLAKILEFLLGFLY
ncbi:MAG: hypothetical protein U0X76_00500 [Bacteroidia bacterium]